MSKRVFATVVLGLALGALSMAADTETTQPLPRIFANARYVYVMAEDGDQFNPEVLSEDRAAIGRVQDAMQKWGRLAVVYRRHEADIILVVQSRASEDVLAVYGAHRGDESGKRSSTYLWRVMGRGGLAKGEMPLVLQFEKAWEKIAN